MKKYLVFLVLLICGCNCQQISIYDYLPLGYGYKWEGCIDPDSFTPVYEIEIIDVGIVDILDSNNTYIRYNFWKFNVNNTYEYYLVPIDGWIYVMDSLDEIIYNTATKWLPEKITLNYPLELPDKQIVFPYVRDDILHVGDLSFEHFLGFVCARVSWPK